MAWPWGTHEPEGTEGSEEERKDFLNMTEEEMDAWEAAMQNDPRIQTYEDLQRASREWMGHDRDLPDKDAPWWSKLFGG